jgi:DNA modification methylase
LSTRKVGLFSQRSSTLLKNISASREDLVKLALNAKTSFVSTSLAAHRKVYKACLQVYKWMVVEEKVKKRGEESRIKWEIMSQKGTEEGDKGEVGYKSVWDFGREAKVYPPHDYGDYPTKILPQVARILVRRFSNKGDTILDPFCGGGTFAVEAKINGRNSINYDINPRAVDITREKLRRVNLLMPFLNDCPPTQHVVEVCDARKLPLPDESVDCIITDIPYASMIKYSDLPDDLSNLDYESFLVEIEKAFREMYRVLKRDKYCVIFVCDYRIGAARKILPIHSDVIQIMREIGFILFDIYIWRYYRSGSFRPFGKRPYQAMNLHSYILVFYKGKEINKENRPVRFRKKLIEKLQKTSKIAQ